MKNLGQNKTKPINNLDCLSTSNIFKYQNDYINKPSKYKYHLTNKNSSNSSNISIKLIDCQIAAHRHNRIRSHYQTKTYRHQKTNQSICYRHFPFSCNPQVNYNNIQKRYHINSINPQSITQLKSRKDNETNISITIQKISNKNIHSNKKLHDSFISFGTNTINQSNKSILNLKEKDSQTCLYRRISNDELDFRNEQKRITNSFISIENHNKSSLYKNFKQSSNTILIPIHTLKQENEYSSNIKLKISFLNELTNCIIYQSPLEVTIVFNIIPACIMILINYMIRMSFIQIPSLPLIILDSDNVNLWRNKTSLNIRCIDNGKDQEKALFDYDQSRISDDSTNFLNKKYSSKDNEHHIIMRQKRDNMKDLDENSGSIHKYEKVDSLSNQAFETLSSTNQAILEGTILPSNLPIDQSFKMTSTIDGIDKQESIINSKLNKISLSSDHIHYQFISESKDRSDDNISSSLSMERPHLLKSNENFKTVVDHSINNLHPTITTDIIHSPISTEYIDEVRSISIINPYSSIEKTKVTCFNEKLQTLNEPSNTNLGNIHLHDMLEQIINQRSDSLLTTVGIPKYSSTSLQTMTTSLHDKEYEQELDEGKANLDDLNQFRVSDDAFQVKGIDQNEEIVLKRTISFESKILLSETNVLDCKNVPLMATSLSKRKIPYDNEDLHLLYRSSESKAIQVDNTIQQFDQQEQSNDKFNILPLMKISGTPIDHTNEDKDSRYLKKEKRYNILNQISNFQSEIHNTHVNKSIIDSSSSILANTKDYKQKNKLSIVSAKGVRRKKRIRKKQICIQPSWISPNENPSTYNYLFNKSTKQTSLSLKPLRDPCEVLEFNTQFKHIHCKPYQCICTPLPSCLDISSCSFIENAHMCNIYLM
ncbi:unnamed protein product [Rotaria sordida]|uniref:Uncharacterized protein n=3 Tax=Rotaria sordida TaxID=392033 RepID=A0A814F447_9BILA|nr:unnamed protein product [Rotaria sordida]